METFKEYVESLQTKPEFDYETVSAEVEGMVQAYETLEAEVLEYQSNLAKKDDEIETLKKANFEIRKDLKDDDFVEEKESDDIKKEKKDIVGDMLGISESEDEKND